MNLETTFNRIRIAPLDRRLLINMYINQIILVKYNDSISNGVTQRGCVSPTLF